MITDGADLELRAGVGKIRASCKWYWSNIGSGMRGGMWDIIQDIGRVSTISRSSWGIGNVLRQRSLSFPAFSSVISLTLVMTVLQLHYLTFNDKVRTD